MASNPTPSELPSLADLHEQDARDLRTLLIGMAEQGAVLAGLYVEQAKDQADAAKPGAGPAPECATAYTDVSRSVRQSVMLIQKLTAPAPAPKAVAPDQQPVAARKQIIRKVEDAIYRDGPPEQAERLRAELLERLEDPEFEDELAQRPVADIIVEIERDLGVHGAIGLSFWKRRTPADLALLAARAAAPGCVASAPPLEPNKAPARHDTPPIRGP